MQITLGVPSWLASLVHLYFCTKLHTWAVRETMQTALLTDILHPRHHRRIPVCAAHLWEYRDQGICNNYELDFIFVSHGTLLSTHTATYGFHLFSGRNECLDMLFIIVSPMRIPVEARSI
jgi:hypothetical protein